MPGFPELRGPNSSPFIPAARSAGPGIYPRQMRGDARACCIGPFWTEASAGVDAYRRASGNHFPRKFVRILSANQTTKIAANERAKYSAVHKSALLAFVMASSLASEIDLLPGRIAAATTADLRRINFAALRRKWW
ncbi:hypothetical protein JQ607_14230 [Bradyrhizobium liaoningense]|uniref:hypothetical protein n=1 Tax=Bradyrhizobium liaoningense TaxID=43992 RepID=UPI001BAB19FD|nr:hypothetical protein [Bradyrhizobium liaoningense]MBR0841352.1 hypothetical protein [Bradyrhizobium liaoningense]